MKDKFYKKSGFILFALIFAPVGIFLMMKYTDWSKKKKALLACISVLILIIALANNAGNSDSTGGDTTTNETQEIDNKQESAQTLQTTIEDYLNNSVTSGLGRDKLVDIERVEDNYYMVTINGADGFTSESRKRAMHIQAMKYFDEVFTDLPLEYNGLEVTLAINFTLVDVQGNKRDEAVMKLSITQETADGINWANIVPDNMPKLVDTYWESTVFNN